MREKGRVLKGLGGAVLAALLLVASAAQAQSGALDPTFGDSHDGISVTRIGSDGQIAALAVQSDGKIVAAGSSEPCYYGCQPEITVARFTSGGDLDRSFGSDGVMTTAVGTWSLATAVRVQSDGKVLVAGVADLGQQTSDEVFALVRYLPDGSLDSAFGDHGIVTTAVGYKAGWDAANGLAIQVDHKIVVAGQSLTKPDGASEIVVARYSPNGSLDASFGDGGTVATSSVGQDDHGQAVLVQPDGKIIVGASSSRPGIALARYRGDGALDPTFGSGGTVLSAGGSAVRAITLQADGKVVAAGGNLLQRYTVNGSLDSSFGSDGTVKTDLTIDAAALQAEGRILAAGQENRHLALARYDSSGGPDPSFGDHGELVTPVDEQDQASGLAIQSDGKIIVGGYTVGQASGPLPSWLLVRYLNQGYFLNTSVRGNGDGSLVSRPFYADKLNVITCPTICGAAFAAGSNVVLTAVPAPGSVFAHWTGACKGSIPACPLLMNADQSATAVFSICMVPKLKGMLLKRATKVLRRAHCSLGAVWKRVSHRVPSGRVIAQDPRPRARRAAGTSVSLLVATRRHQRLPG